MFERDSFIAFVGPASGSSYANGLMNIERLYGSDIDAEYEKDRCDALLRKLIELKSKQPEGAYEVSNIRNRISQLKRYIQFKDNGGGERLKIVGQIRACMKDVPLGTHLKRQQIIDLVVNRFNANPASIIPSDYCYNTTNKGKTGSVNFFLNVATDEYEYVGENYVGMGISDVVALCKKDYMNIWEGEKYKWQAIKHFKAIWDFNAPDFAAMLTDALSKAGNLLAGAMYYPYKMICQFAEQDPETVKSLFEMLFKMRVGDVVMSCYSASTVDAIGVVTGEYEWHDEYERYKRIRPVKWLVKGISEDITQINNGSSMTLSTVYRLNISLNDVVDILRKYKAVPSYADVPRTNHVFIIDEINRGNISKVFGELITLIEPSKRLGQSEGITARLPYSNKLFGVPDNVYLIGTMNTADRSIATIDTALRRRFQFKEMQPDPDVLAGISVEDISIRDMLIRMNRKISVLYDREHTIGHAYFIPLKANPTIETLAAIFENSILPLLQEYFYDDYEKIRLVLGDNNKPDAADQFIVARSIDYTELFGTTEMDLDDSFVYEINRAAFDNIEAYRSI